MEEVRSLFASSGVPEAEVGAGHVEEAGRPAESHGAGCSNTIHRMSSGLHAACILHQHGLEYECFSATSIHSLSRYSDIAEDTIDETTKQLLQATPMAGLGCGAGRRIPEGRARRTAGVPAGQTTCQIDEPGEGQEGPARRKAFTAHSHPFLALVVGRSADQSELDFHKSRLAASTKREGLTRKPCRWPLDARPASGPSCCCLPPGDSLFRDRTKAS